MLHHVPCITARNYMCVFLTSHLLSLASRTVTVGSKHLKAFLHSWLLLSNAYGIFHASFDYLTKFFYPLRKINWAEFWCKKYEFGFSKCFALRRSMKVRSFWGLTKKSNQINDCFYLFLIPSTKNTHTMIIQLCRQRKHQLPRGLPRLSKEKR